MAQEGHFGSGDARPAQSRHSLDAGDPADSGDPGDSGDSGSHGNTEILRCFPDIPENLETPQNLEIPEFLEIPETPEIPEIPEIPVPRAAKVDREGLPGAPETRFPTISGRFSADFQGFSRLRRAIDLACSAKGRTSVFIGRRGTKQRFRILRKSRKSMKIVEKSLQQACRDQLCEKTSIFSLPVVDRCRF